MASESECASSPLEDRITNNMGDLDDLKSSILAGIESKLSQKEETMWRRGLVEIKRLQSEHQNVLLVVGDMQQTQESLATENQALRAALCAVTAKFELVVNEMRQALRQLPGQRGELSPTPSVASTAAPDASPGLGGLLHTKELAQGRVLIGHLERALQRYGQLPEDFEGAWMGLSVINEKARLVTELNNLIENRLEVSSKIADSRDECRTLLGQYEDALRKLQKSALLALENHNASPATQEDSSLIDPTPPSSKGNVSMTLGPTPSWPTGAEDTSDVFRTPPRTLTSFDNPFMGDSSWQASQGPPGFAGMSNARPAVLSLANALTLGDATTPTSQMAAAGSQGVKQLQFAECLVQSTPQADLATPPASGPGEVLFKVELQKDAGFTTLGMEVGEENGASIRVQSIDEHGLVGRYNRTRSSEASTVHVGDLIVGVNGVFGNTTAMLQECKSQQILILTVARSHCGTSPAASSNPHLGANAPTGVALSGDELDRVHDEVTAIPQFKDVAAPPTSWGRLRPEASAFVPSAQAASQAKAPFHEASPASEAALSDTASPTAGVAVSIAAAVADGGENGLARLLFPE